MKKTVCIIYGGKSQEHDISLQSAASIYKHIDRDRWNVICIGIDRHGVFRHQESPRLVNDRVRGEMLEINTRGAQVALMPGEGFVSGSARLPVDIVFPILHGPFGEDGTLQGALEMLNLPYTGAGVLASALAMDKEKSKIIWRENGFPVVDWITVNKEEYDDSPAGWEAVCGKGARLGFPSFVKPVTTGSSVGVAKVRAAEELSAALRNAFTYDRRALVERAIDAREIECAVIGNDKIRVFPPGEIVPRHEFYSYEAKYLDPDGARLLIPAELSEGVIRQVMDLAAGAYQSLSLEGFARVDLFLDRGNGRLYLNEINSIPGFTHISMFPRLCAAGGLPYRELLTSIIEYGFERHAHRSALRFDFQAPATSV